MKNVWIFNHYAQEPSGVGGMRHFHFAHYLKGHNWDTSIIASSVSHRDGTQRIEDDSKVLLQNIEGVNYLWMKTHPYIGNKGGRIRNMIEYSIACLRTRNLDSIPKPDVIIGSSVHPLAGLVGWRMARKFNVPFVFEVRDLWPQTLIDMGRIKQHGIPAKALRILERFLYKKSDIIITLLPFAGEYIQSMGIKTDKITWISNGTDISDKNPPPITEREENSPLQLTYFGAHGDANGLEILIEAMLIIKNRSENRPAPIAKLTLIGDGLNKISLQKQAKILGLDSSIIQFMPLVPKKDIAKISTKADAFVITIRDLPELYKYGISTNKLFDYMGAARPTIIATAARNNPIEDCKGGISVPPEDPQALADAICTMALMNSEQLNMMGESARFHVKEEYSYKKLTEKLSKHLNSLA